MTMVAYEVDCLDMLDLTDVAASKHAGINRSDLACAWEELNARGEDPPSWALARRLTGDGVSGVLVPSFASGSGADDINVVFWRWSDGPPHQVRAIDDAGRLPRDDRSWR